MIFKVLLSGGGLILPLLFPQALSTEFRVHWRGGRARSARAGLRWSPGPMNAFFTVTPPSFGERGPWPSLQGSMGCCVQPSPPDHTPAGLLHGPQGRAWNVAAPPLPGRLWPQPSRVSGDTRAPRLLRTGHSASPGVRSAGVLCACFIREQNPALRRLEKDERWPPLPGPSVQGPPRQSTLAGHRQTRGPRAPEDREEAGQAT